MKRRHLAGLVSLLVLFGAVNAYADEEIEVDPNSYDFGDVNIGTPVTTSIRISNVGDSSMAITDINMAAGSDADFSITDGPFLPTFLSPRGFIDVEITFTPSDEGMSSAVLEIASSDADEPEVQVPLSGTGIGGGDMSPSEQMAMILEFVEDSVENGTLVGSGPGKSANGRLKAFINKLERASDLIEAGLFEEACSPLRSAYLRVDGENRPPDFAAGDAAPELASMIQDLMEELGC